MRTIYGAVIVGLALSASACGGEAPPPPQAPPAPVASAEPAPAPVEAPKVAEAPKPSLAELEQATVKAHFEALNAHDAAKLAATFAPDGVFKVVGAPDATGRDAIAASVQRLFDAFANFKVAPSRIWTKNDVVVIESSQTGTHSGEFAGVKATDKPIGFNSVAAAWFNADGSIKELHLYWDAGVVLAQIGATKQKPRAIPTLAAAPEVHTAKATADEDKNVDILKQVYAAYGSKKDADFLALNSDDVIWDDAMMPAPSKGKEEAKKGFKSLTTAFPDIALNTTNAWGIENFAIVEGTLTGTQKGKLGPFAATKKPVTLHFIDIVQLKDGKVVNGETYASTPELLDQLGLTPKAKAAKTDAKTATTKKTTTTTPAKK